MSQVSTADSYNKKDSEVFLMEKYIGVKIVEAEPCKAWKQSGEHTIGADGYRVKYSDNYVSWSPKDAFRSYFNIHKSDSITQQDVDSWIKNIEVTTIGIKTTVVRLTLINGFELVESSSCVDPKNYDENLGAEICIAKIKDKIWFLLGFLLQCSKGKI